MKERKEEADNKSKTQDKKWTVYEEEESDKE